jgi:hypothetical protein
MEAGVETFCTKVSQILVLEPWEAVLPVALRRMRKGPRSTAPGAPLPASWSCLLLILLQRLERKG